MLVGGEGSSTSVLAEAMINLEVCRILISGGRSNRVGNEDSRSLVQGVEGCLSRLSTLSGSAVGVLSARGINPKNFSI